MARVEIADTQGDVSYSKVLNILAWETGLARVTQSASHTVKDGMNDAQWKQRITGIE
jgi:hypothetical protein